MTDDKGRYRIFGLSPGKYVIGTTLDLDHSSGRVVRSDGSSYHANGREHMFPEIIPVYSPGTFRRKEAKVVEVRGDEQVDNADLTIDPNGLHVLRGKILAAEDRHSPVAIIRMRDETEELNRLVESEDDGTFEVNYLPSGSYTLLVTASDPPKENTDAAPTEFKEYKSVKLPVVIGDEDVFLDEVLLTTLKPGQHDPIPIF